MLFLSACWVQLGRDMEDFSPVKNRFLDRWPWGGSSGRRASAQEVAVEAKPCESLSEVRLFVAFSQLIGREMKRCSCLESPLRDRRRYGRGIFALSSRDGESAAGAPDSAAREIVGSRLLEPCADYLTFLLITAGGD
jgi:hypothetical protein